MPAIACTVIADGPPRLFTPARASSPARWGSSEPCTAWNSCSGARAISSTLNTKPATAASLAVRSVVSTAALSSVCSASMIASTATAKRPPRATLSSSSSRRGPPARGWRANASGTTTSDTNGAAAMPSATAVCPSAIPTATASANISRDVASRNTSPP